MAVLARSETLTGGWGTVERLFNHRGFLSLLFMLPAGALGSWGLVRGHPRAVAVGETGIRFSVPARHRKPHIMFARAMAPSHAALGLGLRS